MFFEANAKAFAIGDLLKEARKKANITQTELALKVGTTKHYTSRIENGHSDIQVGTLVRIVELGFGAFYRPVDWSQGRCSVLVARVGISVQSWAHGQWLGELPRQTGDSPGCGARLPINSHTTN
jgi:transcriptional regulator with XRE-family HTH domain